MIFKSNQDLLLENIMLRQQLAMYQSKEVQPDISDLDRSVLVALKQTFSRWKSLLLVVKPETLISWQKERFKSYWRSISKRKSVGRKRISRDIIAIIKRMRSENRWGASRIYSELLKLGYTSDDLSQRTVSRYLRKIRSTEPDNKKIQTWLTFLKNHRDVITAMDFFTVPDINFNINYVFFLISHKRREILHWNITQNPTAQWVIQQLREAFPFECSKKYLIHDRDSIFSKAVREAIEAIGMRSILTSFQSPWQNGIAERFAQTTRNDLLNNVIIFNEKHLRRLMKEYINYYNNDRSHLANGRDSPHGREIQQKPDNKCQVVAIPKVGGLQHKYIWKKIA